MQGLVDLASQLGYAMAVLLPSFCYAAALGTFLFGGWGLWMQSRPDNPFRGRPWVPWVSLVLCGAFASFDQILTLANGSAGTGLQVSVSALTSYTPPAVNGGVLGASPADGIVNVVKLFQAFFQAFGAMACFFAVYSWRGVINGGNTRSQGGCAVQFVFGIMLINILTISQWLVNIFQT